MDLKSDFKGQIKSYYYQKKRVAPCSHSAIAYLDMVVLPKPACVMICKGWGSIAMDTVYRSFFG